MEATGYPIEFRKRVCAYFGASINDVLLESDRTIPFPPFVGLWLGLEGDAEQVAEVGINLDGTIWCQAADIPYSSDLFRADKPVPSEARVRAHVQGVVDDLVVVGWRIIDSGILGFDDLIDGDAVGGRDGDG